MAEYITKSKLKEYIEKYCNPEGCTRITAEDVYKTALTTIECVPTADVEEVKWIDVNERLPDKEGWYLVYTTPDRQHKSINKAEFCKGYEWNGFEPYWRGAGGHWGNVTHWMPLPEPPKGARNGE